MILAAGLGTRMRPITETLPKPLVEVAGKPLIAYRLEALGRIGVTEVVVNVHYLAPLLSDWLSAWPGADIAYPMKPKSLLDSGGGIVKALAACSEPSRFWFSTPTRSGWRNRAARRTISPHDGSFRSRIDGYHADDRAARPGHRPHRIRRFHHGRMAGCRAIKGSGDPVIYAGAHHPHPRIFKTSPRAAFPSTAALTQLEADACSVRRCAAIG
jgi:MurNAc alpha-1-phosphate uridylyltransferase